MSTRLAPVQLAAAGHGFCCFSNVSLAAAHAIAKLGAKRVAIVDWDVHHGACCYRLLLCSHASLSAYQ